MKLRILLLSVITFTIFAFSSLLPVNAESSYILPYPSVMPGSIFYKFRLIQEKIQELWYFGSFGSLIYNMKQADRYLVEAKTLFEYKQYLLGSQALDKSNYYFSQIPKALLSARLENKNISEKQKIFREESQKHIEILLSLKKELPETFLWQPEKEDSQTILLQEQIKKAIALRIKTL